MYSAGVLRIYSDKQFPTLSVTQVIVLLQQSYSVHKTGDDGTVQLTN
jgi:hypothetical protein